MYKIIVNLKSKITSKKLYVFLFFFVYAIFLLLSQIILRNYIMSFYPQYYIRIFRWLMNILLVGSFIVPICISHIYFSYFSKSKPKLKDKFFELFIYHGIFNTTQYILNFLCAAIADRNYALRVTGNEIILVVINLMSNYFFAQYFKKNYLSNKNVVNITYIVLSIFELLRFL